MGQNHLYRKVIIFSAIVLVVIAVLLIGSSIFSTPTKAEEISPVYKYYTSIVVEKGDTLWNIANRHMNEDYTDIEDYIYEIKELNHLDGDSIYAGEYLMIPYYSKDVL